MEEEVNTKIEFTPENVGKGVAFLGMVLFLLNIVFYLLSRGQPDMFHLFASTDHLIVMSVTALVLVICGYALTKVQHRSAE